MSCVFVNDVCRPCIERGEEGGGGCLTSVVTFAHFLRQLVSHLVHDKSTKKKGAPLLSGGWMGRVGAPCQKWQLCSGRVPRTSKEGQGEK